MLFYAAAKAKSHSVFEQRREIANNWQSLRRQRNEGYSFLSEKRLIVCSHFL